MQGELKMRVVLEVILWKLLFNISTVFTRQVDYLCRIFGQMSGAPKPFGCIEGAFMYMIYQGQLIYDANSKH